MVLELILPTTVLCGPQCYFSHRPFCFYVKAPLSIPLTTHTPLLSPFLYYTESPLDVCLSPLKWAPCLSCCAPMMPSTGLDVTVDEGRALGQFVCGGECRASWDEEIRLWVNGYT
jgi:hypothetical protein